MSDMPVNNDVEYKKRVAELLDAISRNNNEETFHRLFDNGANLTSKNIFNQRFEELQKFYKEQLLDALDEKQISLLQILLGFRTASDCYMHIIYEDLNRINAHYFDTDSCADYCGKKRFKYLMEFWLSSKVANIYLDQNVLQHPYFKDFAVFCQYYVKVPEQVFRDQLILMKEVKIGNFSLYDFVKMPIWKLTHYFKNNELHVNDEYYRLIWAIKSDRFPLFTSILKNKYLKVCQRAPFYSVCVDFLWELFKKICGKLPKEMCENIVDYLSAEDLEKFCNHVRFELLTSSEELT